jgi:NADH:ubiquinone oxidoreductase subunit 4 (subunit M)
MLSFLIALPLVGVFVLSVTEKTNIKFIRNFSLFWSLVIFNISILLLFFFDPTVSGFQFLERID